MNEFDWFFIIWTTVTIFNIVMAWRIWRRWVAIGMTAFFVALCWGLFLAGVYVFPG